VAVRVATPILLVDDDADFRAALAVDLTTKGYEFRLGMKGAAMNRLSRLHPALDPDRTSSLAS
jgi:ActR/RegA family two-component response regulator